MAKVRISAVTTGGTQVPVEQLRRLGDAAGKATDSLSKASKAAEEGAKAQERAQEQFRSTATATVSGVASGAIGGYLKPGGTGDDAFYGGVRALQAALPGLGATLGGAIAPDKGGFALGGALGAAAAEGLGAKYGPEYQAREQAIAMTADAFAPAAAQGVQITKEEYREVFLEALRIANSERNNQRSAREATGY